MPSSLDFMLPWAAAAPRGTSSRPPGGEPDPRKAPSSLGPGRISLLSSYCDNQTLVTLAVSGWKPRVGV